MVQTEGGKKDIPKGWFSIGQACERLGRSPATVQRLAAAGHLDSFLDTSSNGPGKRYFDPDGIMKVLATREEEQNDKADAGGFAKYELGVVKSLIEMIRVPREKIDELQFGIIERQEKQIEKLLARQEADRELVETAKNDGADRETAMTMITAETEVKKLAGMRMIETVNRLMQGKGNGGLTLTPEQAHELMLVGDFLTPDQAAAAQRMIASSGKNPIDAAVKVAGKEVSDEKTKAEPKTEAASDDQ